VLNHLAVRPDRAEAWRHEQAGTHMKVSLVVASGAHQGKVVPITGPQFLIGRDAQCHLRPASQAISKHHCGVLVRDGQVYVKDFGSTNGTLVNDVLIRATEVGVVDGATLKLGPLDFIVRIELAAPQPDGTPLPGNTPETAAALAAVKAATGSAAGSKEVPVRDATPSPIPVKKPAPATLPKTGALPVPAGSKAAAPAPSKDTTGSKEAVALKTSDSKPDIAEDTVISSSNLTSNDDDDRMAAMLLGMADEGVPEGSTVVELPAVDAQGKPLPQGDSKPDDKSGKKPVQSREEMSSAASDLLRKMMRRPK
jgi:pSer/pThr/pTyr-binding forkhead associated (FHA) protein